MNVKVAIDAGHFKYTPGKRCLKSIDPSETREWYLNSRVAAMLSARLADYKNVEVMRMDDTTGEHEVSLAKRCQKANDWGADIYLSVHHNAGIRGGTGGGTVVFYCSGLKVRAEQARRLYDDVVAETGLRGNRSNGVVYRAYYVLRNTKMPAFLLENGFMDSKTDTPIILTQEHAEKTAKGLEKFLADTFDLIKKEAPVEPENPDKDGDNKTRYNTIEEVPDWGRDTIKMLVDKGYLKGDGVGLDLSYDLLRTLVILDRAGQF